MSCGKAPGELPPGIPLSQAAAWRQLFTELKLLRPELTRKYRAEGGGIAEGLLIGGHTTPREVMLKAGLPIPDTDPREPWLFQWYAGSTVGPLQLGDVAVTRASGATEVFKQGLAQGINLIATRCRLVFIVGRFRGDSAAKAVIPYSSVTTSVARSGVWKITTRSGFGLSIAFGVKMKQAIPLLPRWLAAVAVAGADSPADAESLANMYSAARQRRTGAEAELEEVVERFAEAVTYLSGPPAGG